MKNKMTQLYTLFLTGMFLVSATLLGQSNASSGNDYERCSFIQQEQHLKAQYPNRLTTEQFENWLEPLVEEYKQNQTLQSNTGVAEVITIPVVVHVIHNGEAVGTAPNITDAQVESQITVLNQDFRRMINTPGHNTHANGADVEIEFCLAKQDPDGNATTGIDRVNLGQASFSFNQIESNVKPNTIWDATKYMNMWSLKFTNTSLLGYAQFPSGSTLTGLNANGGAANTDGVVAGYRFFGSSDFNDGTFLLGAPFDKGRTMTHEVGHYLGLRHIWGDGDCSADDFCADTPNAVGANYNCPTGTDTCPNSPGVDMIENYMDYTNDTCMNIFTNDQKNRVVTVMNNSPRRVELKTSIGCQSPLSIDDYSLSKSTVLYPNPADDSVRLRFTTGVTVLEYSIFNMAGQKVLKGKLNLNNKIVTSSLKSGIYFVKIKTTKGLLVKKLVIK